MSAHTPGPWAYDNVRVYAPAFDEPVRFLDDNGAVVEHRRGLVALPYSCGPDVGSGKANARLIAAAPDLLAALKAAMAEVTEDGIGGVVDVLEIQGRAAIAKAEGTS